MNETWLRWKARIGALKPFAIFTLIIGVLLLCVTSGALSTALKNQGGPKEVAVEDIITEKIGASQYVTVKGYAIYDAGYEQTEDGKTTATYYVLLDDQSGYLIMVKSPNAIEVRQEDDVIITGMTRSTPTDLQDLIESDMAMFEENDFTTSPKVYIQEGATPGSVPGYAIAIVLFFGVVLLSIVPLFFPSTVFTARPLPQVTENAPENKKTIKSTGRYLKLAQLEPTVEIGKGARNFTNANTNIIPQGERSLLLYIHFIYKTKTYGVTVHTSVTDWGLFLNGSNVIDITPGKLYGWKDRWAIRFRYNNDKGKEETAYLFFEHPAVHLIIVDLLRQLGFMLETPTE